MSQQSHTQYYRNQHQQQRQQQDDQYYHNNNDAYGQNDYYEKNVVSDPTYGEGELLDEEPDSQADYFVDEIYDIVDSVVPKTDDPNMPALTFRVWVIGGFFGLILCFVNTIFTFRTNLFSLNPFIILLLAYPVGRFLAWTLPLRRFRIPFTSFSFRLNPGPFSIKEHTLIFVIAGIASKPAYALYNIIGQKFLLKQEIPIYWCILLAVITQFWGYGLAGICRKYLVRPAVMLWPATLSTLALLRSLHEQNGDFDDREDFYEDESGGVVASSNDTKQGSVDSGSSSNKSSWFRKNLVKNNVTSPTTTVQPQHQQPRQWMSRSRFFWLAMTAMALYQIFPSFITPILGSVSLLCYMAPNSDRIKFLGSAKQGVGLLSLSFDWSIIAQMAPIVTPLWTLINQFVGLWITLWIIIPLMWTHNAFGKDQILGADPAQGPNGTGQFYLGHALNTPSLFNKDGIAIPAIFLVETVNKTLVLDPIAYEANAPIYLSTYFAVEYMSYFVVFTAVLSHVCLWYGAELWHRFKTSMRELDSNDIHAQLMDVYVEVPDTWYVLLLSFTTIGAVLMGMLSPFELPWWSVFLSLGISIIMMIPIGTIEAISGQRLGLNVIAELIMGFLTPGKISAVMTFKSLTYAAMFEGLSFVEDLKLGHFAKIPPRSMFFVQLVASVVSVTLNVLISVKVYEWIGVDTLNNNPPEGWTANAYQVFLSAGSIWGAIGPARFFGAGSPYAHTLYGFVVGAVLPFIFYGLHLLQPDGYWNLVNVPLIAVLPVQAGSTRSDLVTPFLVGILVNYVIKKYRHSWWKRYAYVMSSAFDTGSAIGITLILLAFTMNVRYQIVMPFYALNPFDQESCAPDYYNTCNAHFVFGNAFGRTYNVSDDSALCQTFGMLAMDLNITTSQQPPM
ncbi:hypothetical protein HDU76_005402 [Blyttiomyces sp. JEL0837]|nr:hypothetical protein HDU76_005402 [Blyttiomyces sp. JEL0837]